MTIASLPHYFTKSIATTEIWLGFVILCKCVLSNPTDVCVGRVQKASLLFRILISGMPMFELEDIWLYCTEGENIDF